MRAQVLRLALQHDLAVGEDVAAVGDRQRELDVLLDEDDAAAALLRVLADDRQQALDDHRRQAEAQLVEQQKPGVAGERPPDGEHLLLAAGEQAAAAVAKLGQRGEVPVGDVRVEPLAAIAEAEVLGDGEPEEQAAVLRDVCDAELARARSAVRAADPAPRSGSRRPSGARGRRRRGASSSCPRRSRPSSATISPGATSRSRSRITAALS